MAGTYTRDMPTPEIVKQITYGSGGTGTYRGVQVVRVAFNGSSTANGSGGKWINPETGTVAARVTVVFTTAGTGTIDVGVSTDGTGSNNNIVDGGTMLAGAYTAGTVTATAVTGNTQQHFLVGPGGTGTNNSIVLTHNDTPTSTAVGALLVEYFLIG